MLRNYFKIAYRNLVRHKGYTFINVFGLAVGIAVCLVIGLFVQHELSYDRFHEKADRTYRVVHERDDMSGQGALTPRLLGPLLQAQIPEVEQVVRVAKSYHPKLVTAGERRFYEERFSMQTRPFSTSSPSCYSWAIQQPHSANPARSCSHRLWPRNIFRIPIR